MKNEKFKHLLEFSSLRVSFKKYISILVKYIEIFQTIADQYCFLLFHILLYSFKNYTF